MKTMFLLINLTLVIMAKGQVNVNGFIREKNTGENIPFADISILTGSQHTFSNEYGFYSIETPSDGAIEIIISAVGFEKAVITFRSRNDTTIDVEMKPLTLMLDEITITSESQSLIQGKGFVRLRPEQAKNTPMLLGEKDILKALQRVAGVNQGIEGSTGLYIRGGSPDQNLIILDDAPVYNPNHLFGFFSVFNADAVKNVQVWKSGFPAQYGGRVASVIDIQVKDGDKQKLKGEGGIGILSSRLTLEGPLIPNKVSFLISGRRSYIDLLMRPFVSSDDVAAYRFYDGNAKINWDLDSNNRLYASVYTSDDKLVSATTNNLQSVTQSESRFGWGNLTTTMRWNHRYSAKLFGNVTILQSKFNFYLRDEVQKSGTRPRYEFASYKSAVTDYSAKSDFDYYINNNHHLKAGVHYTYHIFRPKASEKIDLSIRLNEQADVTFYNHETALYVEDNWQAMDPVEIRIGARFITWITAAKTFQFIEPRITASYDLPGEVTLHGSYTRANQFVHLLSNTGLGLSTDLWVPSTSKAPPVQTDLWSAGITKHLPITGISFSLETYRKYLRNILAYTQDATFLVLSEAPQEISWEDNVVSGKGLSYGTELMVERTKGRFTGMMSYTLSWAIHQFDSLNNGQKFFSRYDNRHAINISTKYQLKPKIQVSINWTFNSGIALTAPQTYYYTTTSSFSQDVMRITPVPYFGPRNSFRTSPYHRLDVAIQFHKKKKRYSRYWEVGIFNAYNRKNALYYYFDLQNSPGQSGPTATLKKRSLFPILPSVTYNIQF